MKKKLVLSVTLAVLSAMPASGVVFINEVAINTPGGGSSSDAYFEYIELMGTPGKKLDGYAVATVIGGMQKLWPAGTVTACPYEIDEFFSLDGLELGPNGILVLGKESAFDYPSLLSDANFVAFITNPVWNGYLDTAGNLENDGSNTILLLRNRPGATEATYPLPPVVDLRWGKDTHQDCEFYPNAVEDPPGTFFDQWGDGNLDRGEPLGFGGATTLDMKGAATLLDVSDDLEIVDEVSFEQDSGWEYDMDDRLVEMGSTSNGLPERNVHTLDDPQGFNPDALSRVDYRTKGDGWTPIAGAVGQMANGNNWQDTATEQWIRGELRTTSGSGSNPPHFYDNAANLNGDAIQPFVTNVPRWLHDNVVPDYDFATLNSYQLMAGRINPLAVAFIPGDSDRDGDCDAGDIAKIAAVFGDADWIFSNSFELAPEGDEGDPATQTRPWDVDATGTNGIEASDLQWTLNFQGNTNGQIVGVAYDSTTPAAAGVVLNPNAGTACTVTASASTVSGRSVGDMRWGDRITLTVSGELTAGANTTAGQENGIMQFVHDFVGSTGGVVEVTAIEKLGAYATTRASIETLVGANGDLGVDFLNGYTTSFAEGLTGSAGLYRVQLRAVGAGTTNLTVQAAAATRFAASTPAGLKIGHTDHAGDPGSAVYPAPIALAVFGGPGDYDGDSDVDLDDFAEFGDCLTGPGGGILTGCEVFDLDVDGDVDLVDFGTFQGVFGG